ncbi:hypothetical protein AcV5_010264 [Taiwanofungus camphoratus]|nr:hypothetical protein AcV5_010264 [Antrodia cinnamomea]
MPRPAGQSSHLTHAALHAAHPAPLRNTRPKGQQPRRNASSAHPLHGTAARASSSLPHPHRPAPHLIHARTRRLPVSSPAPLVGSAPVLADNTILHPIRAVRAVVLLQAASARPRPVRLAPSRHRPRELSVDLRSPSPASAAERSVRRGVERLGSRHGASAHRFGSGSKSFDAVYLPRAFGERLVFSCVIRVLQGPPMIPV